MSMAYSGRQVTSARIVFCSTRWSRSLFLITHQLGHVLGLQHSPSAQDVMAAGSGRTSFSPRERLTLSLMFQRGPGNTFPDNDRQVVSASARGTIVMVD